MISAGDPGLRTAWPLHDQRMGVTAHQLNHLMMPKCLSTSEPESTDRSASRAIAAVVSDSADSRRFIHYGQDCVRFPGRSS